MNKANKYLILLLLLSTLASHWPHLNKGPRGVHVWRQCNSLAVASNFHTESMDIFNPRVDHRKHSNGITGMNFPAYEYLVALSYKLIGYHTINHRLVQLLLFFLAVIGIYFLAIELKLPPYASLVSAFAFAWSPILYYYSVVALPDVLALTTSVWSIWFYLKYKKDHSIQHIVYAALLVGIAGLTKLQYLMFALFFIIDALVDRHPARILTLIFMFLPVIGGVANWYIYAMKLRNLNHLYDFGLFVNSGDSGMDKLSIIKGNLISDLPEMLIGYALLLPFLAGLYEILWKRGKKNLVKIILIGAVFLLFHLLELKQMKVHDYYMFPYMVGIVIVIGYGAFSLRKAGVFKLIIVLCILQVAFTKLRIDHRFTDQKSGLPVEFTNADELSELQGILKGSHRALVGPDPSGCIYFYYLEVKGYNAFSLNQIQSKTELQKAFELERIDVIAVRNENKQSIDGIPSEFRKTDAVGEFEIYRRDSL